MIIPTRYSRSFFLRKPQIVVLMLLALSWGDRALVAAPPVTDLPIATFFQQHCFRCHGPETSKGQFRLDQIDTDFSSDSTWKRWSEIVERIRSGEMPPATEQRPSAIEVKRAIDWLTSQLDEVSARRRSQGRVVLRRLNRVEFENTVRDLFGVNVSVQEMLPPDAKAKGFDNVSSALVVSPDLMEGYFDAIDKVITKAIAPVHHEPSRTERFELGDTIQSWFKAWKMEDGTIIFNNNGDANGLWPKFQAPDAGRYRFRVQASAYQSKKPLPIVISMGDFIGEDSSKRRRIGYFDIPPGGPTRLDLEESFFEPGGVFRVMPVTLPYVFTTTKPDPKYPGPGLKIHWIEIEGPLPESWPTDSYRRVCGNADIKTGTLDDAEQVLRELLPRAFRRPTTAEELKPFVTLVAQSLEKKLSFEVAMRIGIKAMLSSPKFLYLRETEGTLDDYALASRLSYFLWSTMPDETLLALAARGELSKPAELRAQVERMLGHARASAFTENFTGQWLSLRDIDATVPDKILYPEYDELLHWSMLRETHLFFEELLKNNLSVTNIVDSEFTMLNGRLARHYGIPGIDGVDFRKVMLNPAQHRGGVLTHASVLKVTANGTSTSPVIRGVWVMDRILGQPVPAPPPNVPAIEPDIRGATTIRQQLARHRSTENCSGCHSRIDPPGFALENYDVTGGWRVRYRVLAKKNKPGAYPAFLNNADARKAHPLGSLLGNYFADSYQYALGPGVEAGDTLPDGQKFADLAQYKKLLLAKPDQIARNVTERLVTYATGQPVGFSDRAAVDRILAETKASDYGLRDLIHALVQSDLFLKK